MKKIYRKIKSNIFHEFILHILHVALYQQDSHYLCYMRPPFLNKRSTSLKIGFDHNNSVLGHNSEETRWIVRHVFCVYFPLFNLDN